MEGVVTLTDLHCTAWRLSNGVETSRMSPTLREIRIFVAVYEEQSFTAAALREHATQSGVSQHVRNLEERLGVQLLARAKGVQPTPAGTAYYRRCLDVLRAHAVAQRTLEEFSTGIAGDVAVGLPPTLTRSVLAPAFLRLSARHPNIGLRVVEAYTPVLADSLRAGDLDFAILPRASSAHTGVRTTLFTATPEFLVCAARRGLVDGSPIRLVDVPHLKLVLPGASNARRQALEQHFASTGVQVDARLEFDSTPGALDLVAQSDWCVIFPGLMIADEIRHGRFTIHPLVKPALELELFLTEPDRQPLSAAATAFLQELRDVTDEVNAGLVRLLRQVS